MSAFSIRGHAWIVAALVFAAAIFGDAVQSSLPCGTSSVIQRLQFSESNTDIEEIAPPGSTTRTAAIRAHLLDNRVLVPAYFLLFTAVGLLFMRTGASVDRGAGAVVIAAALIATLFDVRENHIILSTLSGVPTTSAPRAWATAKWVLVFTAVLTMAVPFLRRVMVEHESRVLAVLTGLVFAIDGVIGMSVVRGYAWIASALVVMAIGMLLMALLFIWSPRYLVESV